MNAEGSCSVMVELVTTSTQAALLQHVKRAAYLSGYVWANALYPMQELPFFRHWGWTENGKPHWTDLPEASRGVGMLLKCRCEKGCSKSCTCVRAELPCTELYKCKGKCRK